MNKNIETFINAIKINDDICIAYSSVNQLEFKPKAIGTGTQQR